MAKSTNSDFITERTDSEITVESRAFLRLRHAMQDCLEDMYRVGAIRSSAPTPPDGFVYSASERRSGPVDTNTRKTGARPANKHVNHKLQQLIESAPVVIDGAWGTQMQEQGLPIGACPDAWNLTHPDRVEAVARAYVEAGSRIILTNTFGANRICLSRHDLADRVVDINRAGAAISRQAAGDRALVFASMGPSGILLASGEISLRELRAAFKQQAKALAEGGADGIVVETMSDLEEARAAVAAACETGLPVVASMAYGIGKVGDRTIMGVSASQAGAALAEAGASVVGANCGSGARGMIDVCQKLRESSGLPVWIKPNAGFPVAAGDKVVYDETAEEFSQDALDIVAAGATFIGGCCGTTPAFIQALANAIAAS